MAEGPIRNPESFGVVWGGLGKARRMNVGCGERGANRINGRPASGEPHLRMAGVPDTEG